MGCAPKEARGIGVAHLVPLAENPSSCGVAALHTRGVEAGERTRGDRGGDGGSIVAAHVLSCFEMR